MWQLAFLQCLPTQQPPLEETLRQHVLEYIDTDATNALLLIYNLCWGLLGTWPYEYLNHFETEVVTSYAKSR